MNIGAVRDPESAVALVEEMGVDRSLVWSGDAWRKPSWSHTRRFDFGSGLSVPAVACVRRLLEGAIARPGVHLMGHVVDPARQAMDMARMGIHVEVTQCAS